MRRFFLLSLAVVIGLYAAGYFPARAWDPPQGGFGLLSGLTFGLALAAGGFAAVRWAILKSQRLFMTVFAAGFVARMVVVVAVFFVYAKFVGAAVATFAVAFGICYLSLSFVEFVCLKEFVAAHKKQE